MSARRLLIPLVVALLPSLSSAASAPEGSLSFVLRCEACTNEQAPILGLLWQAEADGDGPRASVEAIDWSRGAFRLASPDRGDVILAAEPAEGGGWALSVPVSGPSPFRVVAVLPGFAADKAAFWPEREPGPHVVTFQPVEAVLEERPEWDPSRTGECDVLVPKQAATPVTFFVQGQPRAWLTPTASPADAPTAWTFQFVKPGEGLLERVSVPVTAFDEGSAWSFRVPLQAILGAGAAWPSPGGAASPRQSSPVNEIRVSGVGTILLEDCPRATR